MDRRPGRLNDNTVVPLGVEPPAEEVVVPRPSSKLHSGAVAITSVSAATAILSWLAFVTVNWSGPARRVVIAIAFFSVVGFLAGVAATVFTAARDTYVRTPRN